ncbi:type VII secretion integral membrane protein EccD [Streptomyces sp. CA-181903]|uniref:type VII secretion integral membrane protein EccD n=1 Tax=Streptomyces sp. CA-181903 TaxID=3240055 RepID=UPI003D908153
MANVGTKTKLRAAPGRLSRVTLVAEHRRVDVVLPADEPIGRLLPDVLRLLGDRVDGPPAARHLMTVDGTLLPQEGSLAEAGVVDGAILRLVRIEDAPSAPVVHDVTDEVADDLGVRAWRWRPAARQWTAGVAAGVLAAVAALFAWASTGATAVAPPLAGAAVLAALLGAAAAARGGRPLGTALVLVAGEVGTLAVWAAADGHSWSWEVRLAEAAAVWAWALVLLGLPKAPLGRGGLIGAGAVVVTTAVWEGVALVQPDAARVGCVLVVVSAVALGALPRAALMAAGLTALDDRRAGGASVSRYEVRTALAAAHRGLVLATAVTAVSVTAGGLVAVSGRFSPWSVALTAVAALVLFSRSRAFPLIPEVVALLAGACVLLVRLVLLWHDEVGGPPYGPVAALAALALIPLGVLAVQPPEHVRVRLRRAADVAETLGLVALFPLAVGEFGVFERLLHQF